MGRSLLCTESVAGKILKIEFYGVLQTGQNWECSCFPGKNASKGLSELK